MKRLPWQTDVVEKHTPREGELNLSLYLVSGPYALEAYVIANSGQEAIDALVRLPESVWGRLEVYSDQCQAEYLGQTHVPKRQWTHMLADMDSPSGLILSKALD
jgi:hypothetical protein